MKDEKLKLISKYCKNGKTLDIGFSKRPNKYIKTDGLDIIIPKEIPKNYQKIIKHNLNKNKIPIKSKQYDNIILADVIEHIENPSQLLRECRRLLKNNGRLIISTPQPNDIWTNLHNWFFRNIIEDSDKDQHLHVWSILDMKRLLKINNFKIIKILGYKLKTPFRKPLSSIFNLKYFPILSWQVIYINEKNES